MNKTKRLSGVKQKNSPFLVPEVPAVNLQIAQLMLMGHAKLCLRIDGPCKPNFIPNYAANNNGDAFHSDHNFIDLNSDTLRGFHNIGILNSGVFQGFHRIGIPNSGACPTIPLQSTLLLLVTCCWGICHFAAGIKIERHRDHPKLN